MFETSTLVVIYLWVVVCSLLGGWKAQVAIYIYIYRKNMKKQLSSFQIICKDSQSLLFTKMTNIHQVCTLIRSWMSSNAPNHHHSVSPIVSQPKQKNGGPFAEHQFTLCPGDSQVWISFLSLGRRWTLITETATLDTSQTYKSILKRKTRATGQGRIQ